jgi:hypothetical protein
VTDPGYTAIAVLMDRSGSMQSVRDDAEGALRAFIADQRELPGRCTIRLSDFDDQYRSVYGSTPIADAPDYVLQPRGSTALLDGIGRLVTEFGAELAAMPEAERPGTVIVVIQTDGHENSSLEWTRTGIRALITQQREGFAWEFLFLGAGQDAVTIGSGIGIPSHAALRYASSGQGTAAAVAAASAYVGRARAGARPDFTEAERAAAAGPEDGRAGA